MRFVLVLALIACSSKKEPDPPPAPKRVESLPPKPARLPANAASRLLGSPCGTAQGASFAGVWAGSRPFDRANPMAHRGPTRITIKETGNKLRYIEGVGAAAIDLELDVDPAAQNYALGASESTKQLNAVHTDGSPPSVIAITKSADVALCLEGLDKLHVARRLTARGQGIQPQEESDTVVLEREPPPPPAPPPPAGFEVLASDQSPHAIALSKDDVVWTHHTGEVPATYALRAVPRAGGAVRELAPKLENVFDIEVYGEHVYVSENGARRIARIPLAGGAIETVVDDVSAEDIAIGNGVIVWSEYEEVFARKLDGGKPRLLVKLPDDNDTHAIAIDGNTVYIAVSALDLDSAGKILRVPVGGGAPTTIGKDNICGDLVIHKGAPYWASCDGVLRRAGKPIVRDVMHIEGFAFAGGTIVIALGTGIGKVVTAPVGGGKPVELMSGRFNPEQVVVDPDDPAWAYVLDGGLIGYGPSPGRIGRIRLGKST